MMTTEIWTAHPVKVAMVTVISFLKVSHIDCFISIHCKSNYHTLVMVFLFIHGIHGLLLRRLKMT